MDNAQANSGGSPARPVTASPALSTRATPPKSPAAALTSDKFDNRAFNLTGPEALDYAQAAKIMSSVVGKDIAYNAIDDK